MSRANLQGRGKVIQLAFVPKDFDAALRLPTTPIRRELVESDRRAEAR
jgi:hypothetical protein